MALWRSAPSAVSRGPIATRSSNSLLGSARQLGYGVISRRLPADDRRGA